MEYTNEKNAGNNQVVRLLNLFCTKQEIGDSYGA